jgi:hypothetical protein
MRFTLFAMCFAYTPTSGMKIFTPRLKELVGDTSSHTATNKSVDDGVSADQVACVSPAWPTRWLWDAWCIY